MIHDSIGDVANSANENVILQNIWSEGPSLDVIRGEGLEAFIFTIELDLSAHPVNGFSTEKLYYVSAILFVWKRQDELTIDDFPEYLEREIQEAHIASSVGCWYRMLDELRKCLSVSLTIVLNIAQR